MGSYLAALLWAAWAVAVVFQSGMWVRECLSRHGGTGVGYWLPGAMFTFAAPFLGLAIWADVPMVLWIFPGAPTAMGGFCLIEALVDDYRARREVKAGLVTLPIDGRR